jgi:hypothetical protein
MAPAPRAETSFTRRPLSLLLYQELDGVLVWVGAGPLVWSSRQGRRARWRLRRRMASLVRLPSARLRAMWCWVSAGQRSQPFAPLRPRDRDRVDAVGLPAPASAATRIGHRLGRHAQDPLAAFGSETARTSPRHAGSPQPHTPARRRARAPRRQRVIAAAPTWTVRSPTSSPVAAASAASVCERSWVSYRARSLTSPTPTSIYWTSGGHGLPGALPMGRRVSADLFEPNPAMEAAAWTLAESQR